MFALNKVLLGVNIFPTPMSQHQEMTSGIQDSIAPLVQALPVVWDALEGATFSSKDDFVGLWFSLFLDGKFSFSSGFLPEFNLQNASYFTNNNSNRKKKVILRCLKTEIPPVKFYESS